MITRGPHKSCHEHITFLHEEFINMINKQQWIVLPYSVAKTLPGLRLSPPGVVPQRGRRPQWIVDYSCYDVNADTLPIAPSEAMRFGHALDRLLHEILLADPTLGPIYILKLDISDGFYRINLAIEDIPRLGVVFPVADGEEPLVAFPLVCQWAGRVLHLLSQLPQKLLLILQMQISKAMCQYPFILLAPLLLQWMTPLQCQHLPLMVHPHLIISPAQLHKCQRPPLLVHPRLKISPAQLRKSTAVPIFNTQRSPLFETRHCHTPRNLQHI